MKLLDIAYVNLVFLVLDRVEDLYSSFEKRMRIAALQYANGQVKHCDDLIEASQCFPRVFKRFLKQYLRHHHIPSVHCKDHICYSRKNNKIPPKV